MRSQQFAALALTLGASFCNSSVTEFLDDRIPDPWAKRRKITIDNSAQAETLTNFPLMVRVDSARIDYANTQDAGQDLQFRAADGQTVLSHEVEKWNESGSSYAWVKIPQIDASSATGYIWMYYGNTTTSDTQASTNVWDASFKSVLHLKSTGFSDASSAANDATNNGTTAGTGKIGDARSFNGTSGYMTVTATGMAAAQGTMQAWAYPTAAPGVGLRMYVLSHRSASPTCTNLDRLYLLMLNDNPPTTALHVGVGNVSGSAATTGTLSLNAWNFIALTWNAGNFKVYLNGTDVTTGGVYTNFATLDSFFTIGQYHCGSEFWQGMIDEVRFSSTARSTAWLAAEYKSMNDTYLSFGAEEKSPGLN